MSDTKPKKVTDPAKMREYRAKWRAKNKDYRSPTAKPRSFYLDAWLSTATPEEIAQKKANEIKRASEWAAANPERVKSNASIRHAVNREQNNARRRSHYESNKKAHHETSKRWIAENKERHDAYRSSYYEENKDKLRQQTRDWNKANPDHWNKKRANDPDFALLCRLRSRLRKALLAQGAVRSKSTKELIGCSPEEFRSHIEAQFLPGMNWGNRSEWHLDHKLPCKHFDLRDPSQQAACFHYSNIQPLWSVDNRKKSAKVLSQYLAVAA